MSAGSIPRLLLFDIDGTLIKSCNSSGQSLLDTLSAVFNKTIAASGSIFAGGTDQNIISDVLEKNGITRDSVESYESKVKETMELYPQMLKTGINKGTYKWNKLENVDVLLESLSKKKSVKMGLLTGNIQPTAKLKLQSAGIDLNYFYDSTMELFGAFGSDHHVRSELVKIAKERYEKLLETKVSSNDLLIIGDTPKDIKCAHDNKVSCVAVAICKMQIVF